MSCACSIPIYYELPDSEPPIGAAALEGDQDTDIAVVGGGLAGLAVALSLVERGAKPVVLEAAQVGDGASGRNGGFLQLGWAADDERVEAALGSTDAAVLFEAAKDAVALVKARVARHAIRTEVTPGIVEASFFAGEDELRRRADLLARRHGVPFEHLDRAKLKELYRTSVYRGGVLDPCSVHLDPLALTRGYARAVLAGGGRLFEHSPVHALVPEPGGIRLVTAQGRVRARQVVLATSVYGQDPDGRAAWALLPVMTYALVTEPLGRRLEEAIRAPYAVFDDRFAMGYWRPLPDGRLLWGGKIGLTDAPRGLEAAMLADLRWIFPQLGSVAAERVWSGRMGFTRHRMPLATPLGPNLWLATGFCGHGLGTTTAVGELLAAALLEGDRRIDLLARFGRPWAGGVFGPLAAQLLYGWLELRDHVRLRRMGSTTIS
ncbi:MAG TPA: FAD-binding oxidoreductase [Geminicoccus sp.]|uniref:NAD(P)/FAD-dependent oxidoreductase n=1 Tax=Geminicoccus sp. TaxID=2024832 RepID=UPI002CEA0010|nr:FAD-binding oxidoreductase [Geminicoccus sp.]HWL72030.1 FAD-binding oxidoreductase [Geminicoccus sp.]